MTALSQSSARLSPTSTSPLPSLLFSEPSSGNTDSVQLSRKTKDTTTGFTARSRPSKERKRRKTSSKTTSSFSKRSVSKNQPESVVTSYTRDAVDAVIILGMSIEETSKLYKVDTTALKQHVEDIKNESSLTLGSSSNSDVRSELELSEMDDPSVIERTLQEPEVEAILGQRVTRQFLVRWQGESKAEATWVDEDMFTGLYKPPEEELYGSYK